MRREPRTRGGEVVFTKTGIVSLGKPLRLVGEESEIWDTEIVRNYYYNYIF